jgi:uncharacterized RDD family membrane protein YckC
MAMARTNTLLIRTPEGVSFTLDLAGPITRFFAWGIDFGCIVVVASAVLIAVQVWSVITPDLAAAAGILLYSGVTVGYGILMEWFWRGQTLGKRLMRLRVVDAHGLRLQFSQVVIRNLIRVVDALPALYLVGGLTCILSRRVQRLGDYAANTVVVRMRPRVAYDIKSITAGKYNSFREFPHIEARLRQHTSPAEAALAFQALMRRDELDPQQRVILFRRFAGHFKSLVTFPGDATFGLTDEQYVRNVVNSLFRTQTKT